MSFSRLDHIVIGAATLSQGVDYIQDMLGVHIHTEGLHERMSTHNRLMKLGNGIDLEIIAINPLAKPPSHPRWFVLDDADIKRRLEKRPQLLTWVVSIDNIFMAQKGSYIGPDTIIDMTCGNYQWRINVPIDGHLPESGFLPTVIQWRSNPHPTASLPDLGCTLQKIKIHHRNHVSYTRELKPIGAEKLVSIHSLPENTESYMIARIQSLTGIHELISHAN